MASIDTNHHSAQSPSYFISAPWRSSGKTMVSMGLAAAAVDNKLAVQTFKKGPDFIDPLWLQMASHRACYNLDFHQQTEAEIIRTFATPQNDTDLNLVEGTMGLHDGVSVDGSDSNAAMAKLLGTPIILVVDCRGMHRTVAAFLNGLAQFDTDVLFAGVILNRIRTSRHGDKVTQAIDSYTDMSVLGVLPEVSSMSIAEKHLGLTPAVEHHEAELCIQSYRDLVVEHCDVHSLFAKDRPSVESPMSFSTDKDDAPIKQFNMHTSALCRIGIARDEAFHFYYQDDLEYFQAHGIELVELSPLRDSFPDNLNGLLIGGGFPERYAPKLSENIVFINELKCAVEAGLPVHAECAGLMYLCNSIKSAGRTSQMVGVIDATISMQQKPVGRGYMKLSRLQQADEELCVHEFHHSRIEFNYTPEYVYRVDRGYGIDGSHDGVRIHNVIASYAHFRHTNNTPWIDWFLDRVPKVN